MCIILLIPSYFFFFFFLNHTATTEIYTLSLHDALPISRTSNAAPRSPFIPITLPPYPATIARDRKSTRLNSSPEWISYAVFCLNKKMVLHRSVRRRVQFSYRGVLPWAVSCGPPLLAVAVPFPWRLLLLLGAAVVALTPGA